MPSKTKSELHHFKKRMAERFGVIVSDETVLDIIKCIQQNRAKFVEKQSLRVSAWDVVVSGHTVRVIYDKSREMVVTALPVDEQGNVGIVKSSLERILDEL